MIGRTQLFGTCRYQVSPRIYRIYSVDKQKNYKLLLMGPPQCLSMYFFVAQKTKFLLYGGAATKTTGRTNIEIKNKVIIRDNIPHPIPCIHTPHKHMLHNLHVPGNRSQIFIINMRLISCFMDLKRLFSNYALFSTCP